MTPKDLTQSVTPTRATDRASPDLPASTPVTQMATMDSELNLTVTDINTYMYKLCTLYLCRITRRLACL